MPRFVVYRAVPLVQVVDILACVMQVSGMMNGMEDESCEESVKQPLSQIPSNLTVDDRSGVTCMIKRTHSGWTRTIVFGVFVVAFLGAIAGGVYFFTQGMASEDTSKYSEEFLQQKEALSALHDEWAKLESEMRASGKSEDEISRSKGEYYDFILTTLIMKVEFESTLSDTEKRALLREIDAVLPEDYVAEVDRGCAYKEEELPLQDFFEGAVLKFSNPMVYVSGSDSERAHCSSTFQHAEHELWSVEAWRSFDRQGIAKISIDPETTFTVERRLRVVKGGLFGDEMEHYVLRDSNGNVSVPAFMVFDGALYPDDDDSGSHLYKDGTHVGHVIYDLDTSIVWLEEAGVPEEVIDAHEPKERNIDFEQAAPYTRRYEFLRRIMFALEDGELQDYTQGEMIELGLADGIYETVNGSVVNEYGGIVDIVNGGTRVSVTFRNIPSGEDCRQFYFINDPRVFGFSETYIDGIAYKDSETTKQAASRCLEDGAHEIIFRGSMGDIKAKAQSDRRSKQNPYLKET